LDQSSYTARVVGAEPDKDVAVLQLDMPKAKAATLQPVTLGTSSNLLVGQKVRWMFLQAKNADHVGTSQWAIAGFMA
jgi:S1-C subfamily serine protease